MSNKKILIETSARHLHISRADLDVLYGEGHQLTSKKSLSQPGQFACEERVSVVGPKGELKMSILGPERSVTQVELSLTDARSIGIVAPIRESGNIGGSASVKLVGPKGEVTLAEGVIVAKRHVHLTPEIAAEFGLSDKQIINVKFEGDRGLTFAETVCRVSPSFAPAMHIDTDEANAAGIAGNVYGEIL